MPLFLNWITTIASVVAASAVVLAYLQFRGDHERSRRQLSITSWPQKLSATPEHFAKVLSHVLPRTQY